MSQKDVVIEQLYQVIDQKTQGSQWTIKLKLTN